MASVAELLKEADSLATADARRDAEILLSAALEKPRTYLLAWPDGEVPDTSADRYRAWLDRRRQGEPVAYLLEQREFWSLALTVNAATLIPRPDTELLVEEALALELPADARAVDLGTGSGAIALALASERPEWHMTGVDVSADTLAVARGNGEALGIQRVRWLQGSWFDPIDNERFLLIASNPPYIAEGDPHLQQGDLPFEPRGALVAANNGLADLALIIDGAPDHLEPGGWLVLEHGYDQGTAVRGLLNDGGFHEVRSAQDLGGHERVSLGRYDAQ